MKFDVFYETTMRIWPDRISYKEIIEKTRATSMDWFSSSSGLTPYLKKMIKTIACPCHPEQIESREKDRIVKNLDIFIATVMLNMKLLLLHAKVTRQYIYCQIIWFKNFFIKVLGNLKICQKFYSNEILDAWDPCYLKYVAIDFDYFLKEKLPCKFLVWVICAMVWWKIVENLQINFFRCS